ncbi:MAG: ribonuclease III [Elusimicrobia bacterium]|nr:ribonuclease III [Elusimicrobiota bacterium]
MSGLEEAIGYRFRVPGLLATALTHKSFAAGSRAPHANERLEFLGDSVLSAVVAHRLYEAFPDQDEGILSKRKSQLVSQRALARWALELELGRHLRLGGGEDSSGGRQRPSILANCLEALIGAVYLDGGFDAAQRFIGHWLTRRRESEEPDYKSRLQEMLQKRYKTPPEYEVLGTAGPDHDMTFTVAVRLRKEFLGRGVGKSKKEAEQAAARNAIEKL